MARRTIGLLAREAGVGVETIRYYERRGILRRPQALARGWREYGDETLRRLQFIRRARRLEFSLAEIREILSCLEDGDFCKEAGKVMRAKIGQIEKRIEELTALRDGLRERMRTCEERGGGANCPAYVELNGNPTKDRANKVAPRKHPLAKERSSK